MELLKIKNLHVSISGKEILKGLDLTVKKGEIHAIMGPNGTGKSTLASAIVGKPDYEITEGTIQFNGQDLLEMEPNERALAGIFLSFQYPVEIPGVSMINFMKTVIDSKRKHQRRRTFARSRFSKYGKEKQRISWHK